MRSPVSRLVGALAMLAVFYWTLQPSAHWARPQRPAEVDVEALLQTSRDAYSQSRYNEALPPTLALVERYPAQHVYLERLSDIYHRLGRYRDEAATWHRFMERSPTPWDACPAVADAHAAAGDPAGATAAFEKCWAMAPSDPEAAFFLGRAHERSGRLDDAESLYRAALDIDPSHGDSEVGLARLALHRNRFDAARQLAMTVVERIPVHADALLVVALAAQRSDDGKTAREYFARTLEVEERYADAHIGLGILEFGQQNVDAARQHFERALDLTLSPSTARPAPYRPHVFLFVVDSLRRDHLGTYNRAVDFTPAIDRFARESVAFERAFTRYGATGLSVPSIWTGGMLLHKQYVTPFAPMNTLAKLLEGQQYAQWVGMDHIMHAILPDSSMRAPLDARRTVKDFRFCRTLEEIRARLAARSSTDAPVFAYTLPQDIHVSALMREGKRAIDDEPHAGFYAPVASRIKRFDHCFGEFIEDLKSLGLDSVNLREYSYELNGTGPGRASNTTDQLRAEGQRAIRSTVELIADFYGFTPPR